MYGAVMAGEDVKKIFYFQDYVKLFIFSCLFSFSTVTVFILACLSLQIHTVS